MKGLDLGAMFDEFSECVYDTEALEKQICDLMEDDEIMRKSGIYRYVLSGDLRNLCFRTFFEKEPLGKKANGFFTVRTICTNVIGRIKGVVSSWHSPHQRKTHP